MSLYARQFLVFHLCSMHQFARASTAEIVGHSDVANAVSLNSANFNAGRLVGPALSGFLIARFNTGPSFLINATTYLFVILSLLFMRPADFFIQKKEETARH
jgi:MFS family permease